jgi:argininosuccinate lyase
MLPFMDPTRMNTCVSKGKMKMKKLWGGRFDKKTAGEVEEFTRSVSFDNRLLYDDLRGSLAHVWMLAASKLLSRKEAETLARGINKLRKDSVNGKFKAPDDTEDIHTAVQNKLRNLVGKVADKLHTARSRNDQVVLDMRLYARLELNVLKLKIELLQLAIVEFAKKNREVIIPGYTHLQHAQPVLLAHHMLAYAEMLKRDEERLYDAYKRVNIMPLGSGALAGTTLPVNRRIPAITLKFSKISANSMDAVSDRDFLVEILSDMAILMMHLSRLAEDLILWSTKEFGFLDIDESFCTGSSIMPQKKNPDVLELVRGKTGRVYGSLISLLVTLKGLPLSYNRDLQEDKEPFFDALDTSKDCLHIITKLFYHLKINRKRTKEAADDEFLLATDLAEYLVKKKVPFQQAHFIVGQLVRKCISENKKFSDLTLNEFKAFSQEFEKDIYGLLSPEVSVRGRASFGGTSPEQVNKALNLWKKKLKT